jgi:hypothetical protein
LGERIACDEQDDIDHLPNPSHALVVRGGASGWGGALDMPSSWRVGVDTEIIYSVGSDCTNLSTKQPMQNYSFDQAEADTIIFFVYAVLCESGYEDPWGTMAALAVRRYPGDL